MMSQRRECLAPLKFQSFETAIALDCASIHDTSCNSVWPSSQLHLQVAFGVGHSTMDDSILIYCCPFALDGHVIVQTAGKNFLTEHLCR